MLEQFVHFPVGESSIGRGCAQVNPPMSLDLSFYICVMGTALVQEAELGNTCPPNLQDPRVGLYEGQAALVWLSSEQGDLDGH